MVIAARRRQTVLLATLLAGAAGLWYWIFVVPAGSFWVKLTISASLLAGASAGLAGRDVRAPFRFRLQDLPIGVLSAAGLYGVFYVGNIVLTALLPNAEAGIRGVYAPKATLPTLQLGVLLLCLTAVAEEVFWRGFVQRAFVERTGVPAGILLGVLFYSGVHAWTLNVPLILAAAVAGLVWGVQFQLARRLPSVVISHALWSVTIFLVFPVA